MPAARAADSVSAAQRRRSAPGASSAPATRVVWTSSPTRPNASVASARNRPAASNGAASTRGAGKSSPSVTALIFTAEMVALGLGHSVIIWPQALLFVHVYRRLIRALATLSVAVLVACTPPGGGSTSGNRIVTPAPARPSGARATPGPTDTTTTTPAAPGTTSTTPRLRGEALLSADLCPAYRAILDTYVDPVDDRQLIKAAADGLRQELQDMSTLPLLTMPLQLVGGMSGDPDKDWQAFGDAYDSVVTKLPAWAQQAHPDWTVLLSTAASLHDGHTSFMTPDEARRRNETSFAG